MYFGYRYYDPEVGRWISPDPAGAIDGPNLYTHTRNNPMKYVDYFGLNSALDENCGCTSMATLDGIMLLKAVFVFAVGTGVHTLHGAIGAKSGAILKALSAELYQSQ